jgi:HSP20 family protein
LWRRDPFAALREEMNELRSRMWGDEDEGWFAGTMAPSLDLSETDTTVEVRMDLPGIKPKDIDIQLNGHVLTITGTRDEEREEKGRTFHRVERRSGHFSRSLTLPCPVAESEVAAEYHDGVLSITLPKTEESKAHKIKVKG